VATYGRGFWILDDITPLQQLTPDILDSEAHLFAPRPAYRFLRLETTLDMPDHGQAGHNPPYGASINYYLKTTPAGDIEIVILDENGQTIKTLEGTKETGLNRVWWNLRYEPSEEPKLRTAPLYAPHVKLGKEGWRPLVTWGGPISPKVAPGTYTVKLFVEGKEFTQKLAIKKDPNSAGIEEDIKAQVKMLLELRDNSSAAVHMVNEIEWIRRQIYDLFSILEEKKDTSSIITAGHELDKRLMAIEGNLVQLKLTGGSQDSLRWPVKLYAKLSNLAGEVGRTDFPPTTQQIEVHEMFKEQLASYQAQFEELLNKELLAFNNLLKEKNTPHIIIK
jgi:hypothetical protein